MEQTAAAETRSRQELFKSAFREHPAGVAVISAMSPAGPVGLTASSVASVAVDPMTLSFSVTRANGSAGGLLEAQTISVHLLAEHHVDLADAFARSGAPRFTPEQGWSAFDDGEPLLDDARATLLCRITHIIKVGSSSVVLAEVLDVRIGEPAPPLIYHDRRFRRLA